jgi:hypothetical protein
MRSVRIIAVFALALGFLQGATLEQMSLDEMTAKSTDIVRGRVSLTHAAAQGPVIYTHYKVQVSDRWKGASSATMDVVVPGGSAGNLRQTFAGAPRLVEGADYVLFLWTGQSGLTHVIGLSQGVFSITTDNSGNVIALRPASTETVLDASGRIVKDEAIRIRLLDLRSRVNSALGRAKR